MVQMKSYIHHGHASQPVSYLPSQIMTAYKFPRNCAADVDDNRVTAILEFGGGWYSSDFTQHAALDNYNPPSVTDVSVNGVGPQTGTDADGEVALDGQVVAGVVSYLTGKAAKIRYYWTDDFVAALDQIIADIKAGVPIKSVSCSWGNDESTIGGPALQAIEVKIAELRAMGVKFTCATGDNDSSDGDPGVNVDGPSCCTSAIACGGTTLTQTLESVWNNGQGEGTGGGYSKFFPRPDWQASAPPVPAGIPPGGGRMLPDVAANADPNTGYPIYVNGQLGNIGGTSAVAPMVAALFTVFGDKIPDPIATLWNSPQAFNDIIQGNNGQYNAGPGPDPCTGLGSPNGTTLIGVLGGAPVSPLPPPPPGVPPVNPTPGPTGGTFNYTATQVGTFGRTQHVKGQITLTLVTSTGGSVSQPSDTTEPVTGPLRSALFDDVARFQMRVRLRRRGLRFSQIQETIAGLTSAMIGEAITNAKAAGWAVPDVLPVDHAGGTLIQTILTFLGTPTGQAVLAFVEQLILSLIGIKIPVPTPTPAPGGHEVRGVHQMGLADDWGNLVNDVTQTGRDVEDVLRQWFTDFLHQKLGGLFG